MTKKDEPVLGGQGDGAARDGTSRPVRERIRRLLEGGRFAVLCTQGDGQPYGSVVAFALGEDPAVVLFATSRETRKYRLLTACDRVALVVDDRSRHAGELMSVGAVTATGRAREVTGDPERRRLADLFLAKHPAMRSFVEAPSTALFRVDVVRYLHVRRFQEVTQWLPPRAT